MPASTGASRVGKPVDSDGRAVEGREVIVRWDSGHRCRLGRLPASWWLTALRSRRRRARPRTHRSGRRRAERRIGADNEESHGDRGDGRRSPEDEQDEPAMMHYSIDRSRQFRLLLCGSSRRWAGPTIMRVISFGEHCPIARDPLAQTTSDPTAPSPLGPALSTRSLVSPKAGRGSILLPTLGRREICLGR